mgnify:FL=1
MDTVSANNLSRIQIEMTSYCNASCGACLRNIEGGPLNPLIKLEHMNWDTWKKICEFCKEHKVDTLIFNGNIGDISNHPEVIDMLNYLSTMQKHIKLDIHTNGAARSTKFWRELSTIVQKFSNSLVTFSIDGLEDTNHLYRRGTKFDNIMKNASAYISNGGTSRWRMIVFDHNKHQIVNASNRARDMGFSAFELNRSYIKKIKTTEYKKMPATTITAPSLSEVNDLRPLVEYRNIVPTKRKAITPIDSVCPWQRDRSIQIAQDGIVWPCCYLNMYGNKQNSKKFVWLEEKIKVYDNNFNSLQYNDLKTILQHDFFQKDLKHNFKNKLLTVCVEKCNI